MHVTQRGVNRCAIFLCDADRKTFLGYLKEACVEREVGIHAYVLMDNHVHLLVSSSTPGRIASALRVASQRHVKHFNLRHVRTGTLFEGRFKSCLVDSERYLLQVLRYIELNPVRAALAAQPQDYAWSSARAHLGLREDRLITFHPVFEQLADSRLGRIEAYRSWLMQPVDDEEQERIRRYIAQERALGGERFQAMVEKALNQPATVLGQGRKRSAERKAW